MECNKALGLLSGYIDGVLEDDEKNELEKHLNICKSCSHEYEFLKTIVYKCHELDDYDLPCNFKDDLHNRLESDKKGTKNKIILFREIYRTIAAGFIILILSVGLIKGITLLRTGMQKKVSSMPQNKVASEVQKSDSADVKAENQSKDTSITSDSGDKSPKSESQNKAMLFSAPNEKTDSLFTISFYGSVTLNLTKLEYEKYKNGIDDLIKSMGGNVKSSDPIEYTMPYIHVDEFIKKVQNEYKIADVKIEPEKNAVSDKKSEISGDYIIIVNIKD